MKKWEIDPRESSCGTGCVLVVGVISLIIGIVAVTCDTIDSVKRMKQEEINPTPPKVFEVGEHTVTTEYKVDEGQKPTEEDLKSHQGYEVTSMKQMHDNVAGSHNLREALLYDTYKIEWKNNEPVLCKYDAWDGGYTGFCTPVDLVESGEMLTTEEEGYSYTKR